MPPYDLFDHIARGGLLEAWNSFFEFYLWLRVCHERMGWPMLPHTQLRCAMSKARAFSLPGKLGTAAKALGAHELKDEAGSALIRKLCVPRNPSKKQINHAVEVTRAASSVYEMQRLIDSELMYVNRATPVNAAVDFQNFYAYNRQDIKSEAAVSILCPDLSPRELDLWLVDQAINIRGIHIDQKALQDCISIVNQATEKYTTELQTITGGAIQTASERDKILDFLSSRGVHMGTLDADAVEEALHSPDNRRMPDVARRVLEIRDALAGASVKKLFAIERTLCRDSRLRDLFAFCGADRTGRWAGRGAQPQNMPSSGPKVARCTCGHTSWAKLIACPKCSRLRGPSDGCDWGAEAMETALADIASRSLEYVEQQWGDAIAAVSGCLRGLFTAAPGHDLLCSDYSAIEAVVLAEIAGEEWRQEVFRTHGKIYEMSASKITGTPLQEYLDHKKRTGMHHSDRKKFGKIPELASGYGGGKGAWIAFGADEFMTESEMQEAIWAWRDASPAIAGRSEGAARRNGKPVVKGFWYGLQDAAHMAVSNPGTCYSYQAPPTRYGQPPAITYGMKGSVLYCRLPSGRLLAYHGARLEQVVGYNGRTELQLTYMGLEATTKQWVRLSTWGGKLCENVTQAVARDLLGFALPNLERAGYPVVLHVHDEVAAEVPVGQGDIVEFERIMAAVPDWATGWPVKAAGGWRGRRYRKE
jgi:DNA polymerase